MAKCLKHYEREAVRNCSACGKPMCEECAVFGDYCSERCMSAGQQAMARSSAVLNERAKTNHASAVRKIFYIIITLAIAAAAGWFYVKNREEINSKAQELVKKAEQKNQEMFEAAKHKPRNSKYKNSREQMVR